MNVRQATHMCTPRSPACRSSHATVERQPKDSAFDPARGRKDLPPDAPLLRGNWLCASHVADNAQVLRAAAEQAGTEPRAALEVRGLTGP